MMQIYNTQTRRKEEFKPIEPGKVRIYCCGPTVYNYFHIGNARPFIVFDTLRRYLEHKGYEVKYVQNFTDIDDKMIRRANEEGITVKELGDRFIKEYYTDADALGIERATVNPRATEHIPDIIALIEKLIDKGLAYACDNGDVYYNTQAFPGYGKLCGQNLEDLESGARIDVDPNKRHPMDFAVWKAQKPGRAGVGISVGDGPSGLAYRMLCDEHEIPRRDAGYPLRRQGSRLPAPRKRDRPERGRDGQAVRPLLDAQRIHQCG